MPKIVQHLGSLTVLVAISYALFYFQPPATEGSVPALRAQTHKTAAGKYEPLERVIFEELMAARALAEKEAKTQNAGSADVTSKEAERQSEMFTENAIYSLKEVEITRKYNLSQAALQRILQKGTEAGWRVPSSHNE